MSVRKRRSGSLLSLCLAWAAGGVPAASLPPHAPLRILIVSDEVNPHGLAAAELTQPGELAAALNDPASGLNLDGGPAAVLELPTNAIESATAELLRSAHDPLSYDVLIYFAHRIPNNGGDAQGRQAAFVAAVEVFLERGGGVVSFHHGAYLTAGKAAILDLVGASAAGGVTWNTVNGQNVINVAPRHFVTCHALTYDTTIGYADPARGVPAGSYPAFNNTPDERYPTFELNPAAGAVELLFGSDYVENGTTHLLGFTHVRPAWRGAVVAYQPGEHQPTALDGAGRNFQILANALLWSARRVPPDGVILTLESGPGVDEVTLDWSACAGSHTIFRSTDPSGVVAPGNELGSTGATTWIDLPPPGATVYYRVEP